MSGLREDYIEVHKQDAFLALAALDVLIEKGALNGKSMSDEKLTRERIKAAVDTRNLKLPLVHYSADASQRRISEAHST